MLNKITGDLVRFINRRKFEIVLGDSNVTYSVNIKTVNIKKYSKNYIVDEILEARMRNNINYYFTNKPDINGRLLTNQIDTYGISIVEYRPYKEVKL